MIVGGVVSPYLVRSPWTGTVASSGSPALPDVPDVVELSEASAVDRPVRRWALAGIAAALALGVAASLFPAPVSAPVEAPPSVSTTAAPTQTAPREQPPVLDARDAAVNRLLERGRPQGVGAEVASRVRQELRNVPQGVLDLLDARGVRLVPLREGESLIEAGVVRPLDLEKAYGQPDALRRGVDQAREQADAAFGDRIRALQMRVDAGDTTARMDLDIARSDRAEAFYRAVYDGSDGLVDQQSATLSEAVDVGLGAEADRLLALSAPSLEDVARLHGARTPDEIDAYARRVIDLNGAERIRAAQERYAQDPDPGDARVGQELPEGQRPLRFWREQVAVPAYYHVRDGARTVALDTHDATSMTTWARGEIEGQYFYRGEVNALVIPERSLDRRVDGVSVLVHELGHAFEDAMSETDQGAFRAYRQERDGAFTRLMEQHPERIPTRYGRTGAHEMSAEAFALRFGGGETKAPTDPAWEATFNRLLEQTSPTRRSLENAVREIMAIPGGDFASEDGACLDYSAKWVEPLRSRGVGAVLTLTDSARGRSEVTLADGTRRQAHKFHAFLTVRDGQREIVVDPTWKQFVADKGAASHLPTVLVGTLDEVRAAYRSVAPQIQLETTGADPLQGRYDADSAVDLIYSTGASAHIRMTLD